MNIVGIHSNMFAVVDFFLKRSFSAWLFINCDWNVKTSSSLYIVPFGIILYVDVDKNMIKEKVNSTVHSYYHTYNNVSNSLFYIALDTTYVRRVHRRVQTTVWG